MNFLINESDVLNPKRRALLKLSGALLGTAAVTTGLSSRVFAETQPANAAFTARRPLTQSVLTSMKILSVCRPKRKPPRARLS